MTPPNPKTALIFDALVRGLDLFPNLSDIALAQAEFAMGVPLASRALDLAWGFAPITPQLLADARSELCVSRGLARGVGVLIPDVSTETAFSPSSGLGSTAVQGAYAFGSLYLVSGASLTVQSALASGTGNSAPPILMNRDYDVQAAVGLSRAGTAPLAAPPAGTVLEIARFVLDIDSYVGAADPRNRVTTHYIDLRRPRGWGGFAEELFAASLVPPLVQFSQTAQEQSALAVQATTYAVAAWVGLKGWSPNFTAFWQASPTPLPTRLHQYLHDKLGITV